MADRNNLLLISDFTADMLGSLLRREEAGVGLDVSVSPFDQVIPTLLNGQSVEWTEADFAVVWTMPARTVTAFQQLLEGCEVSQEDLLREVDHFADLLSQAAPRVRAVFIPLWVHPTYDRGLGLLDLRSPEGVSHSLLRMNLRLVERMREIPNAYLLNTQKWIEKCGDSAFSPKLWYLGKIPFSPPVFLAATVDIRAAVSTITGVARKLIVLDLDDTLWGGIVGDAGIDGLTLGGPDPVGEAFAEFQKALKALTRRGIILALASKNEESIALDAFQNHPEMVLGMEDISGWRINWNDKAANIIELAEELNLGLQSVVFIDDNPAERDRVREALPEVFVPEWPKDKMLYTVALKQLTCFDQTAISEEDRSRSQMYVAERQRQQKKNALGSLDDWIASLNIKICALPLQAKDIGRTVQLFNKTNQMNLRTRRLTEAELKGWLESGAREVWTFRVMDKFGDLGLTGILGLEFSGAVAEITDFVMSCRVMGRKVEESILYTAVERARIHGAERVLAPYSPTAKNNPCKAFFEKTWPMHQAGDQTEFIWSLSESFNLPEKIEFACDQ